MGYHEKCNENEKFVGNTPTGEDLSEGLKGVKYRIGDVAYDIHGKEINKKYMRPLFVEKASLELYDRIMMAQLNKIRNGK